MSAPLRSLLQFDLVRLREFARRLKGDAWSAVITVAVAGGAAGAFMIGLERFARERLAETPSLALPAAAAAGATLALGQRAAVARHADGPFGATLADRRVRVQWASARTALLLLVVATPLIVGLARAGADLRPMTMLAAGLLGGAVAALSAPSLRLPALPSLATPKRPARTGSRLSAVALRGVVSGAPRWAWLLAAGAATAVLARLAEANGNPGAADVLLLAGAVLTGALAAPAADLFVFLGRTPRPLGRLLGDSVAAPLLVALAVGVAAAVATPGDLIAHLFVAAAAALACGAGLVVHYLNRLAYGPVVGPLRLSIYAGLAAIAGLGLGPFALIAVPFGLYALWRVAAARRWSAA